MVFVFRHRSLAGRVLLFLSGLATTGLLLSVFNPPNLPVRNKQIDYSIHQQQITDDFTVSEISSSPQPEMCNFYNLI